MQHNYNDFWHPDYGHVKLNEIMLENYSMLINRKVALYFDNNISMYYILHMIQWAYSNFSNKYTTYINLTQIFHQFFPTGQDNIWKQQHCITSFQNHCVSVKL